MRCRSRAIVEKECSAMASGRNGSHAVNCLKPHRTHPHSDEFYAPTSRIGSLDVAAKRTMIKAGDIVKHNRRNAVSIVEPLLASRRI
jgi:hypothetical protein